MMRFFKYTNAGRSVMPYLLISVAALASHCGTPRRDEQPARKSDAIAYSVQSSIPHDTEAFTQGFVVHNGQLFESTGQGGSWIGIVDVNTGKADKKIILADQYFGEGITILNNKIYQLTWQNKVGFVYDVNTFREVRRFSYDTEGWGLTHDGTHLIMSDGTDQLIYLDTTRLEPVKKIAVTKDGAPVKNLNELEYINGYIYANIWQTDTIVRINPATGEVTGVLDLTPLTKQARLLNPQMDVLNGIAWHAATRSLLVTGKLWPFIYVLNAGV
jgi:glutamine cyclotransferase